MRYFFSQDEMSMLRQAVDYAVLEHPTTYEGRPTLKAGVRAFKKLSAKLHGMQSSKTADQVSSAAGYERRAEADVAQISSATR